MDMEALLVRLLVMPLLTSLPLVLLFFKIPGFFGGDFFGSGDGEGRRGCGEVFLREDLVREGRGGDGEGRRRSGDLL